MSNHTVVLVEDDDAVRELVSKHLSRRGYRVVASATAEAVLAKLAEGSLSYDIFLTDVHLPGMSGLELSRQLMVREPLKPLILITGDSDPGMAWDVVSRGAAAYLLKPFELFELDAAMTQAVAMLQLVETAKALARSQAEQAQDWGDMGGQLPRSWLHIGDERSGAGDGHGARVVSVAGLLARALGDRLDADTREAIRTAARTHEIGRLLGRAGDRDIAYRTARLLEDLGFDPAVPELIRDASADWSPGLPLAARLLALADRLDHAAVERSEEEESEDAIRGALADAVRETRDRPDPELARVLEAEREALESMWILQRQVAPAA